MAAAGDVQKCLDTAEHVLARASQAATQLVGVEADQ
jgi:hypothetical protein